MRRRVGSHPVVVTLAFGVSCELLEFATAARSSAAWTQASLPGVPVLIAKLKTVPQRPRCGTKGPSG